VDFDARADGYQQQVQLVNVGYELIFTLSMSF
jgi:hypothetical protein